MKYKVHILLNEDDNQKLVEIKTVSGKNILIEKDENFVTFYDFDKTDLSHEILLIVRISDVLIIERERMKE